MLLLMYLRGGSAQTVAHAAALRNKLQIKLCYLAKSQYIDTTSTSLSPDAVPGRVATGVPIFKSMIMTPPRKRSRSTTLQADALPLAQWWCFVLCVLCVDMVTVGNTFPFTAVLGCVRATRGVTGSMSAFLACHQCCCAGLSLARGLNLWALVCGIF